MTDQRSYLNKLVHIHSWAASNTLIAIYEEAVYSLLSSRHLSHELQKKLKAKLQIVEPIHKYWFRTPVLSREDRKILDAHLYEKRIPKPKKAKMEIAKMKAAEKAPRTFHKFTFLPYELQDMVWEFAAEDSPERTIELRTVRISKPGKLEKYSMYIYSAILPPFPQGEPRHTHSFGSPTAPPALLSVSRHAREVAKRHYDFAFRPINQIFLDPATFTKAPYNRLIDTKNLTCPNCTCCTHGIYVNWSKDIFVAGEAVFGNEVVQEAWADDFIPELYEREVFHESKLSIHKIERLALPLRSLWTRNMVTWHLGFLPGVKEVLLIPNHGYDKKAEIALRGKEVVVDSRPPDGKDEGVYMARSRNFRVMSYILRIKEAKAVAEMMFMRQILSVQDQAWRGPKKVRIWTAKVKTRKEEGKLKMEARKVWETVNGKRLKKWMDKNYIPPNFG